jgi:hypothetical protein
MASLMEQRYPRVSRCSGRRACCRILSPGGETDKTTNVLSGGDLEIDGIVDRVLAVRASI